MEWIKVSDELPEENQGVITYDGAVWSAMYAVNEFWTIDQNGLAIVDVVTHWMPMPKPPTEIN